MKATLRPVFVLLATLGGLAPGASRAGDSGDAGFVGGAWQHHKVTFSYFGITTLYTCDGLEDQVRRIVLSLGARADAKVRARGCPGINAPSRNAWIDVDFYSLAPAADAADSKAVKSQWSPLKFSAQQPRYLGEGDCELLQSMKDLVLKNFSVRAFTYRTSCAPHTTSPFDFEIKGDVLKQAAVKSG